MKTRNSRSLSTNIRARLSVILALATALASSHAQENAAASADEPAVELEPFIVTGEVYAFGAQKIVHVSDADLARTQAADVADIFADDPSIRVGGGLPAAQKIYIRGIEDKLLNIAIDGAPQGGYLSHHHGQYLIEPELLKSVEVEPGPGGATQGPGALAGSIRFVSKSAEDFLPDGQRFGSFHKASWSSNSETLKLTSAVYGRPSEKLSLLAAYTYADADDYSDGNGNVVDYTGHQQTRVFAKAGLTIAGGQQLTLGLEQVQDEGVYRHRPNFVGYFNHPLAPNNPVPMRLGRDTITLGYDQSSADAARGLEGSAHLTDSSFDRTGQYEMGYRSLGFGLRHKDVRGDHALAFGFEYRDDTMSFTGQGSVTGFARTLVYRTIPDETVRIIGFSAQDDWRATEHLQISAGARVDTYDYRDKDGKNFKDTGFSPSLGASYRVAEGWRLNASYGLAFRGVTVIDAITSNEGGVTNHPSMDPEFAENAEVGFQYTRGAFYLSGTIHQQTINDVISAIGGVRDNVGDLESTGYDLTAGYSVGAFRGSLAVSQSDPELNGANLVDTDFGIGSSYGRSWTGSASYTLKPARMELGWSSNYVEAFTATPPGIPTKPSYVVHGAYATWRPLADNDALVVAIAVHNVFDEFYVDQATSGYNSQLARVAGLPEPGRDVRVSASYKF